MSKPPPSSFLNSVSRRQALRIGTLTACGLGLSNQLDLKASEGNVNLQQRIARLEREYNGTSSIEVNRLDVEGHFALRRDAVLPTASTCKLFVLCELFRQAEEGTVDLKAPITWKPEFHRGGDGVLRAMIPGQELSLWRSRTVVS